jgi:hypothetical protein
VKRAKKAPTAATAAVRNPVARSPLLGKGGAHRQVERRRSARASQQALPDSCAKDELESDRESDDTGQAHDALAAPSDTLSRRDLEANRMREIYAARSRRAARSPMCSCPSR